MKIFMENVLVIIVEYKRVAANNNRSPDLNPLRFYIWEYLKPTVYAVEASEIQDLQQRMQNRLDTIRTTPEIFQRVRQSMF
jgi:hypothetical protein